MRDERPRRWFLFLGFMALGSKLFGKEYHEMHPQAWSFSSINDAAMALYGKEKFATMQKSDAVVLEVPSVIKDPERIPIVVGTTLEAKTIAIFQDRQEKSLVAVFDVSVQHSAGSVQKDAVAFEFEMKMESKGTLFAVVETLDEKLYYTRAYADVTCLACMAK